MDIRASRFSKEFIELIRGYRNTPRAHRRIWESFYILTNTISYLKKHRDYVEAYEYGYGDRPFHYMWKLLVDQMPLHFSFLEIGVFKGQVISLIQLLADEAKKSAEIYGITPLSGSGDHYFQHPDIDYFASITALYEEFNLSFRQTHIIQGFSQKPAVQRRARQYAPFDMVYIDGSHDYPIVVNDIRSYSEMVRVGGFLILDDASNSLRLPKQYIVSGNTLLNRLLLKNRFPAFKGFDDVSSAAKDTIEKDSRFIHLFACGHVRVWSRVQ